VKSDRIAAGLLMTLGVLTLGTGLYFMAVRPALLPEDLRFTGVDPSLLPPQFLEWLRIVFRTWGGFIAGLGILLLGVAGYLLTMRAGVLRYAIAASLLVAFGRFLVSNVLIRSEYLWFIAVLFGLAVVTALRVLRPARHRHRADGTGTPHVDRIRSRSPIG
jgi:hypothetical protein